MRPSEEIRDELVQLWGRLAGFWGITPAAGRVQGWLLASPRPADAEELARELEMSRGAISMATRELLDWGLATTEQVPGSRRLLYHPVTDLETVIKNVVKSRKRREWDPILENVDRWIPELRSDRTKDGAVVRERLEEIRTVLTAVDEMAASFLAGSVVQNLGLGLLLQRSRRKLRKRDERGGRS